MFSKTQSIPRLALAFLALATLFTVVPNANQVFAQSPDDLIRQLKLRYDEMDSMRSHFSQTTTSTYLDDTEYFEGDILIRGDQYRIEMANQTIVTDGVLTWVYNRSENQVLVNDYEEDENTFSLSVFLDEFDSAYDVVDHAVVGSLQKLELTPQDPLSMFRSVTLFADGDVVVRLDIVDMNDVHMRVELSEIVFNPEISEQSFLFSIPENVEVVDLREN